MKKSYPIVLTGDRATLSSFGDNAFRAFFCTFPHKFVERFVEEYLTPILNNDGTVKFANYGLRKVESLLIDEFGYESVAVVHPDNLSDFVGENTKIIGISVHDPLGLAYVSTTYNSLIGFGGVALGAHEFMNLMQNKVIKNKKAKIVVGGPGVWQLRDAKMQKELGIDLLLYGDAEKDLVQIIKKIMNNEEVGSEIEMSKINPKEDKIPTIKKPSTFGCVEITRGCGRGCHFCTPTVRKKYSFPIEYIMKEVEVNIRGGNESIFIVTDDLFLYNSNPGFKPNRGEVFKLIKSIGDYPGVNYIHLSHGSFAPVVCDPKMIEDITPILLDRTKRMLNGKKYVTIEMGIETGSIRIMKEHMKGKALPFKVELWHDIICQALGILNDNSWYPLCTIMTAMPGEKDEDIIQTLELLDEIKEFKLFYVPIIFIPIEGAFWGRERRVSLDKLNELQWELLATSWKRNFDIWLKKEEMIYIKAIGFLYYWGYMRWKH
ncbi:MAG: radical SAM protein, partial [Candidatus Thermoplasmatota archaeon]